MWQETDTVTRQTGPLYPRPRKCRAHSAQSVGGAEVLEKRRSPWGSSAATVSLGSGLSFSPGRAPHCAPKLTSLQTMQTLSNLQRCKGLDARTLSSSTGKRGPRDTLELGAGPVLGEGQGLRARGGVKLQTALGCGGVAGKCRVNLARGGVAGSCRKRDRKPSRAVCSQSMPVMLGCSSAQRLHRGSHTRLLLQT